MDEITSCMECKYPVETSQHFTCRLVEKMKFTQFENLNIL